MKKVDKGKQTTHTNKYLQSPKPSFPWVYINQAAVAEKAFLPPLPSQPAKMRKTPVSIFSPTRFFPLLYILYTSLQHRAFYTHSILFAL